MVSFPEILPVCVPRTHLVQVKTPVFVPRMQTSSEDLPRPLIPSKTSGKFIQIFGDEIEYY